MNFFRSWYQRHFSNPELVILVLSLLLGTIAILTFGRYLVPVIIALILAYVLDGFVAFLERIRVPRLLAVFIVFHLFLAAVVFLLFFLLPLLATQVRQFVGTLPSIIARGQELLMLLPERYPQYVSASQIAHLSDLLYSEIGRMGQHLLSISLASVRSMVVFLVYLILVPLMVFFFLKDKAPIIAWFERFLPADNRLSLQVWRDVNLQVGNYMRGKVWEILIIWSTSFVVFYFTGLKFAMLTALLVGLSVLVPFIGVTVVAFPVAMIAYFQWGWSSEFLTILIAYAIIQILDGNLLAPLLLAGVVNLHPVAIIVAVLFFGGIWGIVGVFFAIPLATLVDAVIRAWPRQELEARQARTADADRATV